MVLIYIDPGAGSLFVQVLIAGLISVLMFVRSLKLVLGSFLSNIIRKFKSKND